MSDATIKTAVQDTGLFMQDIEERLKYINRQIAIMDYNSDMDGAREEGHAVGLAEGRTQMAIDMLHDNKPMDEIAKYSRLTPEQIQTPAQQINNTT
ncbi:hypothetical protein [uncultured Anaerovibrio sp.]|uniref:hypothetical protein n=1 Tax=uncultured Anaerovibrio sp. TaxID=361586 RepID=UPI00262AE787|nr:hypothetical protein [uncultured Anaerovibrio sp.]